MRFSLVLRPRPAPPRPDDCLNCGVAVPPDDAFCGRCGQENTPPALSFGDLAREAWDSLAQIDTKLLRTLGLLLFRPGFLTAEYVSGRRTRYLSPFKMYLSVSALFFLLVGLTIPFDEINKGASNVKVRVGKSHVRVGVSQSGGQAGENNKEVSLGRLIEDKLEDKGVSVLGKRISLTKLPAEIGTYRANQQALSLEKRDKPLAHFYNEHIIRLRRDPAGAAKSLISAFLPLILLVHLPLFAVWMRLVYFRQKRMYAEHLVFLLHTHTAFFLLLATEMLMESFLKSVGSKLPAADKIVETLIVVTAAYNVLAMRRFYAQDWAKTLLKGWFLLSGYMLLLGFTTALAFAFSVLWLVVAPG